MKKILYLLLLFAFPLYGTTYYIAPTGSDVTGTGTFANPWASLYKACNTVTGVGDIIYVSAGNYTETHKCQLAVNVSIAGAGISSKITSNYEGTSDRGDAMIVLANGTNTSQSISNLWLDGDSELGFSAIAVYNRSNVTINNLRITNFYYHGVCFSGGAATGNKIHDCTIDNCAMQSGAEVGALIWMSHNTGLLVYNNYLTQNTRTAGTNEEGECITGGDYLYGTKIYNNYVNNIRAGITKSCTWPFALEFWSNQHYAGTGLGTEIYGNTFIGEVDFGSGLSKGAYSYSLYIHDNIFGSGTTEGVSILRTGLQLEEYLYDVIIENNIFQGINKPIYFCAQTSSDIMDRIWIIGNQFVNVRLAYDAHNNPYDGVEGTTNGCAIDFGSPTRPAHIDNVYVWNNTFRAYVTAPGDCAIYLPTSEDCDNFELKNNIVVGFTDAPFIAERTTVGGTLNILILDNNILYSNGNSNNLLLQASFVPTNVSNDGGIKSDPLLTSATDFNLQVGSPAIGAGVTVDFYTDEDYYGTTWASPPSIGAVEVASEEPPPDPGEPPVGSGIVISGGVIVTSASKIVVK